MDRTDKYAFKNREGAPNIPEGVVAAASTIVPYLSRPRPPGPGPGPGRRGPGPALDLRA